MRGILIMLIFNSVRVTEKIGYIIMFFVIVIGLFACVKTFFCGVKYECNGRSNR